MGTKHLKIVLKEVHCGNTEDIHGADEFYVTSALTDGSPEGVQVAIMNPHSINDNQHIYPNHVVYEGEVDEDAVVRGGIAAYDEDFAKDWAKKPEWVAKVKDKVVDKLTESDDPYAAGAGHILKWGYDVFDFVASADKDDRLGTKALTITARGPSREEIRFKPYNKGDWLGYSSWNYTAILEVQRPPQYTIQVMDHWSPGWTHLVPYRFLGGPQYFIAYNATSGVVHFDSIDNAGTSLSLLQTGNWSPGWTTVTTLSLGLQRYLLVYNSVTGQVRIDRLRKDGSGSDNVFDGSWAPGWSIVEPIGAYTYLADHLIVYNDKSGHVRIDKLGPGGESTVNVFGGTWGKGWTSLMPFRLAGTDWHFLIYNSQSGRFHIDQFDMPSAGSTTIAAGTWSPGWTHFVAYPKIVFDSSADHSFIAYNKINGDVHFDRMSEDGFELIEQGKWAPGWSVLCPMPLGAAESPDSPAGLLIYNGDTGEVHSDRLS